MSEYLRSIIIDEETPAADGTYTYDLPVNPVSHLILTILAVNEVDEATPEQLAALIPNVQVLHRGTTIFQMRAVDLLAFNQLWLGRTPMLGQMTPAGARVRFLSLLIPFGRLPYLPGECYPESRAGELQIQLTVDIETDDASIESLQLESIQLPAASPPQYMKVSTLVSQATALGAWDIELPLGNEYLGMMLRSNTIPVVNTWTATIEAIRLLANNKEYYISSANWESLYGSRINRGGLEPGFIPDYQQPHAANYALIDFDPRGNGGFIMPTATLSALTLRVTAGVLDEIRVFPIELVRG